MTSTAPRECAYLTLSVLAAFLILTTPSEASGRGRHKQIYAAPAPREVTIDAKLDDWDLSGQILSYVVPETADMQSVRTAMMYDQDALYVCGIVRDSSPMMNRHDPQTDPEKAWDADVCQIFFSLDPDAELPLGYSRFKQEHNESPVATMMLWHFTDRKEACLSMFRGMKFSTPLQPDLGVRGVIAPQHYKGAYRKSEDGGGYTFEYRIPWTTMRLTRTPKANDSLGMSLAVFWSRPDGLKTAGGAAWAYDVMSGPGFSFQESKCWGKVVFHPSNDIPGELVNAGLPPERPLPLRFEYALPETRELHEVTIQLHNASNEVVRLLVPQQERRAGRNVELWDGLDDQGKPLPAGTYRWKGIIHEPITTQWRFSAHNSGTPPYPTPNNKGGWGADHGTPQSVTALKDGMVLCWGVCEYGWGIIRVNLDGKKVWGSKHSARYLANDGKRLFVAGGHGFHKAPGVQILDIRDSRPISLDNGTPAYVAPEGGDDETNTVTGLDHHKGILYVAYKARNLIAAFNVEDASIKTTYALPAPERLAVSPDGSLVVISNGKVLALKDGEVRDLVTDHLGMPQGVDVGPDGTLYVSNQGELQNVSVFSPEGSYLRSLGKPGGRPAVGRYDRSGLYMPGGLSLDARGRLWVAETTDGPKRFGVWDTANGRNLSEFFGGSDYFGYGFIIPDEPDMMVAHHTLWKIDWDAYKVAPYSTIWRKTGPNVMNAPRPSGYTGVLRIFTAHNGTQYAWGNGRPNSILMRREGDIFKPFAAVLVVRRPKDKEAQSTQIELIDSDPETFPQGNYLWQDRNDDATVQSDEVAPVPFKAWAPHFAWIDRDLNAWVSPGKLLHPVSIEPNGQPLYDVTNAEDSFLIEKRVNIRHGYYTRDEAGNSYTFNPSKGGAAMVKWNADTKAEWSYPGIVRWHEALNLPIAGPGKLHGMTGCMGLGGRYLAHMTYFGVNHVFRDDGMYVAALLKDGRVAKGGGKKGTDVGQPEGQNGQFVRTTIDGETRYFIVHGGQDSRVWEVLGLDTIEDIEGGVYEHTEALVAEAKQALADYEATRSGPAHIVIARGRQALDAGEGVGSSVDADRGFEARTAYDATNLYVRFDVTTPSELVNGQPDPNIIFRGGNCLDIQLSTASDTDAERSELVPGDLRILVTRKRGPSTGSGTAMEPLAVLYRPRVAGFQGEPTIFHSPTGSERFDSVEILKDIGLSYRKTGDGFRADVTIPLDTIGLTLAPGQRIKMDLGVVFGNKSGTRTTVRSYVHNNSFAANVVKDIPHESRLEPAQWGEATVE